MQLDETETLMMFIAEVPIYLPRVRVFRRNIVNANVSAGGRHFHARAGIKGQADAYALVAGGGHVEIESKAARGTLADHQKAWRAQMAEMRIPYLLLRILPKEETAATIVRWIDALKHAVEGLPK